MTQAVVEGGIAELARRRTIASGLGGPERVQRQHDRGFLTARERVHLLLDPGTAVPFGPLVNSGVPGEEHRTMGDGHLMGFGKVDGRWVAYSASDATIKRASGGAGSMRRGGAFERIVSGAGLPQIGLMQGGGARITDIVSSRFSGFPGPARISRHQGFPRRGALLTAVMGNYYAPWSVAYRKQWQAAADKDAFIAEHAKVIQKNSEPWLAAQLDFLDDVIDPAATRPILVRALATARARVRNSERHRGWERPHA